jgi:hypothetical protein
MIADPIIPIERCLKALKAFDVSPVVLVIIPRDYTISYLLKGTVSQTELSDRGKCGEAWNLRWRLLKDFRKYCSSRQGAKRPRIVYYL